MHIQDEILNKYRNILKNSPYDKMIKSWGASGPSFHCRLSSETKDYRESEYFYKGKMKFIHWTSIDALISMLNSREIRLYNLYNSSDTEEFNYAAEQIGVSEQMIKHSKEYLFTWSFCSSDYLRNEEMWNQYGRNFQGVAIEFEIVNRPITWENYLLSNVYYNISKTMLETFEKLRRLESEYHNGIETILDLGKLIGFHKNPKHKHENEIRITNYFPFDDEMDYQKYCRKEFRLNRATPTITTYFPLKLWVNNESAYIKSDGLNYDDSQILPDDYFLKHPQIKIRNVLFGKNCGLDNWGFQKFRDALVRIIEERLGYRVEIDLNLYIP